MKMREHSKIIIIIIIIIIIKNFNRRNSHGSKHRELRNTHTHMDRTHSLTHSYNNVMRTASSAIIFSCMLGIFMFP